MSESLDALLRHVRAALLAAAIGASLPLPAAGQPGSAALGRQIAADWMTAVPLTHSSAGIRPPDGAEVEQTPPDFGWPALEPGTRYRLILRYPDGTEHSRATATNWQNWDEQLPAGDFTWQVVATTKTRTLDSAVRRFSVAPRAVAFVVPDVEVLVGRARAKAHPRGLPEESALAAMLAGRGASVARLLRQVDAAAAESKVTAREPAGQDAEQQAFTAVDRTVTALLAYVLTRDEQRYAHALERTLALAAWDPRGPTSYEHADEGARGVAAALAIAYDWLYPRLDAAQRGQLLAVLDARLGDIHRDLVVDARMAVHPYDSHRVQALYYAAMASTLLAGDLPAADVWLRDTLPLALNTLSPWGGEDGGFGNGTAYAQWTTGDALIPWNILRSSVGVDVGQKAWVRNHARFLAYFVPPGAPAGAFGDGAERRLPEQWARFGKALVLFAPTPLGRWYAAQLHGEDTTRPHLLLAPAADNSPAPFPPGTPNAALFPSIGWVAMHSDLADPARTSVYFKSSPYGSFNHSHADQNSFVVVANGEPLAIDSGYYDGYATEHWRRWYKQTRAHNAVTFDGGQGQAVFEDNDDIGAGRITHFTDTAAYTIATGDASGAYGGALEVAERTLVYLRPDTLVVQDRLSSATARKWEWNVHAFERMRVDSDGTVAIESGNARLCISMPDAVPTTFSQRGVFDAEPRGDYRPQWHGTFVTREAAASAELVAVLRVGCPSAPIVWRRASLGAWELELAGHRVTLVPGAALVQPLG